MCYDVSFTVDIKALTDYFPDLVLDSQLHLEFGAIDHIQGVGVFGKHPIIYINREDFKPHCRLMEWSCIEYYTTAEPDVKKRNGMLNIRSERVLDDQESYWYKIRNRRCLIPITGVYEHRKVAGQAKKIPYLVRPNDQQVFFVPGLYSVAEIVDPATSEKVKRWTFGLMTRRANEVMRYIHNDGDNKWRMPLFLPFEMSKEFLSESLTVERYREILNYEIPSEDLYYHTTNTIRTSKPRPDGKQKHEPWEWKDVPDFSVEEGYNKTSTF